MILSLAPSALLMLQNVLDLLVVVGQSPQTLVVEGWRGKLLGEVMVGLVLVFM